jgi:hypothetical protein
MKWYEPIPDGDVYDRLQLCDRNDIKFDIEFHKQHYRFRKDIEWKELEVKISSLNNPGDFYSFIATGNLVLTNKAYIVLEDLIGKSVERLILKEKDNDYFLLKILDFIDCLDYETSKYHTTVSEMIGVDSYVFKEHLLVGKHIFFLPRAHHNVVSQDFKNRVEKFELKGLRFGELC